MDGLWRACLERFRQELPRQQFETWIKPLRAVVGDASVELVAPNRFVLQWIKDRYLGRINELVSEHFSAAMDVRLSVEDSAAPRAMDAAPAVAAAPRAEAQKQVAPSQVTTRADSGINPAFAFSSFVPGRANQLARAAALQVAENPGGAYNPLFIYGGVGLGKTHLIQAVGNQLLGINPAAKVRYVHAEQYVSDVVRAYQHKAFDAFKRLYHSLDLLLIDDIQFFGGKARTQEEFFFAFNALIEARHQIIITCDSFPKELAGIEERLISRFGWGLTVAIEPPELEMRVAILISKAVSEGVQLDEAVAFFIAKHIRSNVRELEGALKRVMAYAQFIGEGITLATTKEALKDLLALQNRQISLENIQKTVADYYKIKVSDMFSKKRNRSVARPRQVAMALAKELTQLSLPEIGEAFGGRDHTTVLHACRKIAELQSIDNELHRDMLTLTQTLRG